MNRTAHARARLTMAASATAITTVLDSLSARELGALNGAQSDESRGKCLETHASSPPLLRGSSSHACG